MNLTLTGWKTYIMAIGLLGLAVYQASVGSYEAAIQSLLAAGAAAGLRNAVAGNKAAIVSQLPPKE
jgi:Tfp pilus assembly protein PilV